MKISVLKHNTGQTLIEATIALASILLTLAAIAVAITTSVSNSQFIKNQTLAGKYSQQGMEYMTYLRTTEDPVIFENRDDVFCMGENGTLNPLAGPCNPTDTSGNGLVDGTFKREVTFDPNPVTQDCGGGTKVTVATSWVSGKCVGGEFCHKSELISCFNKQSTKGRTL